MIADDRLLHGSGTGDLGVPVPLPGHALEVADVNGDGRLDVITAEGGAVLLSLGDGGGGFTPPRRVQTGLDVSTVAVGDLDGDGLVDLVALNGTSNTVTIMKRQRP